MGLILAERIIKRYYHNEPVIQPACTLRSQPSHVCLTKRREEEMREEGEEREAQINRRRKSRGNRERERETVK